ncbi:LOW QUALITY PROTEIN: serine/arginine repetitive matrix protein 2-like [Thrips palmi]|uniref:LOW QUALITY PROTEIN: serine/arginine repetitive matrix protein 2-like n=1 Tax=Thrips palmi TaxID=161013 RepID=A0A6P8ZLX0_THRPL|nr:LOW QUALITY PROTEIN: serine/arginine repetitive matrix protein 2-like [Thrips palmi]
MVVDKASIMNIMGGMESTAGVRLHNHRRKLRQRFDIIKKLGQGTYGKVQLGINKETGQEVAIKTIKKSKIESEADLVRIRREIQIMSSVQHPNIIHIYEVFENREKMVLVMEYAAGGELYDFLSERKVLGEEEARRLFRQIATAVYYCHKHKICHRDLKLENILLDETGSAKIADFGLSNVFDETRLLGTFCGSPLYASPEIVQGTPYHGPEVDCWSLGVLLYTLVYGAMPFDGSNFKRLVKQISQGDYFEPKKPSPASPLIREMLTVSPAKRADIVKICSHWWVNEGQSESCLDIAEHLANQTPVRLDLLLSLAPPVSSEQVVVTSDQQGNGEVAGSAEGPVRSHSVGSLMDLDQPSAERRIRDFVNSTKTESRANIDKAAETPKRKIEDAVSTEDASVGGARKKERSRSKQRSSRSDRRSSSHSRKQAETMDVEAEALPRSDSKDLTLAAACAISNSLLDKPSQPNKAEAVEKTEEKRKSVKGIKKKTKPEKDENSALTANSAEPEASVAEGRSGSEPTQEAKVPVSDASAVEESSRGKTKRKAFDGDQSKRDTSASSGNDKLSDTSPSDESVRSSQSEPCVEEVKDGVNGDDVSEGVVSIMSSSTAPVSSLSLSDTGADIASLDKAKSQGKISLSKIISPANETPAVPVPNTPEDAEPPRSTERRKSKIFETAERFNNLANTERKGSVVEKPKKILIPGVKVSDAKAAYERKSSITSSTTSVPAIGERKGSITSVPAGVKNSLSKKTVQDQPMEAAIAAQESITEPSTPAPEPPQEDRAKKVKDAVGVISSVIEGQVTGRRVSLKKTPKLNSLDESKPSTPSAPGTPLSPTAVDPITGLKTVRVQVAPNDVRLATIQVSTPQATKYQGEEPPLPKKGVQATSEVEDSEPKKTASKMEITLKSATLPRRKTSEAKIQMATPPPPKAPSPEKLERMIQAPPSPGRRASAGQPLGGYRSEVEHMVGAAEYPNRPRHQRSEVSFPVAAAGSSTRVHPMPFRSASCEPESSKSKPREHIIPIHFEADENATPRTSTPPAKPPVPPTTSQSASGNLPYQRTMSQISQRSNSLSRQSTQDSDTESTISQSGGEPIRKSPREYVIPIALEGGGYVTPRATSLEPSEESRASTHSLPRSRLSSRTKRMSRERHRTKFSSLLSESEDEGPFASLHRHSSIGRDSDNEDRPSAFHLHRLRSSRPSQRTLEHTDSMSSAEEEEDDDEGFELLTAENLFSSLLSRVRSLTQRLNVEDGGRPGFPSTRLLSQFGTHPSSRASPFMFPSSSLLSRGSPFEPLSRIHNTSTQTTVTTTFKRISETSRSFSRNDSESGSVGPTPWRRSVSRDVSDTDSLYSESHASGTVPKGRSSGDFSEASSLSSYSYTPSLAARLAQYHQGGGSGNASPSDRPHRLARSYMKSKSTGTAGSGGSGAVSADELAALSGRYPRGAGTPGSASSASSTAGYSSARRAARALEQELNGLNIPASYLPTPSRASASRALEDELAGLNIPASYLPAPSRASAARALEEELNGLNIPTSYLPTHGPSPSRASASDGDDVYSSAARRLGLSRTLSMRERPASPGASSSTSGSYRPSLLSSLSSPARRPYSSYAMSLSDSERPPLPRRTSGLGLTGLGLGQGLGQGLAARASDDDCAYYEIMPSHRKEPGSEGSSSSSSIFTRSCPSSAFLGDAPARSPSGIATPGTSAPAFAAPGLAAATPGPTTPHQEEIEIPASSKTESPGTAESVPTVADTASTPPTTSSTTAPPAQSRMGRSMSVNREIGPGPASSLGLAAGSTADLSSLRRSASTRATPERSILSKFFRGSSSGDEQPKQPKASKQPVQRRISRFLRPDFFDTPREESAYAKEQDLQRSRSRSAAREEPEAEPQPQPATQPEPQPERGGKAAKDKEASKTSSRFLQSLERRLERLRTGQPQPPPQPVAAPPPPPPAALAPSSATSRIESTIRSLREHSLEPKEADAAPTESSLLKRAVSVSDIAGGNAAAPAGSSGGSRIAGRVMSLFRKDPADVKQGLIPSFRPHRSYTGSTSDSVLDGAGLATERPRRKKEPVKASPAAEPVPDGAKASPAAEPASGGAKASPAAVPHEPAAAGAASTPPCAVSVDVSIVLPSRDKNSDFRISCAKEDSSAGQVIIPSGGKVGADKTEATEKAVANGDVGVPVTEGGSVASDPKPTKVARTKSGSKVKGLLSSKSKTKMVKKKDSDAKPVEGDASSISKGETSDLTSTDTKTQVESSIPRPPLASVESNLPGPSTLPSNPSQDSSKSADAPAPKTGSGAGTDTPSKHPVKLKSSKIEETSDGPFVRSFSKLKLGTKDEPSSPPRKSLSKSKIPVDDKAPVLLKSSSRGRLSDVIGKPLAGQGTNGLDPPTSTSLVNGGVSVSKPSPKVIVAKTEGSSLEFPLRSSSRTKLRKDEDKEASPPVKSISRSSIRKEEPKSKEVSPVKSFSRSSIPKEEAKTTANKEKSIEISTSDSSPPKDDEKINSSKETSPVKSASKATLRSKEDSKPVLEREKSLVKSSSRSSVRKDDAKPTGDKTVLVLKSTSRSSLRTADDAKLASDKGTSLVKSNSRSFVLSKDSPKETSLLKSSSRSSVLSKDSSKETSLIKSSSRSSVLSKDSSKETPLLKSSSRSSVPSKDQPSVVKSSSRSSVRKDEPTKPAKSLSRTRIPRDDVADLSVVSDPAATPPSLVARSSSRTKLLRSDEKTPPRTPPKPAAGDDTSRVVTSPTRSASRTKIPGEAERKSPTKNGADATVSPLRKSLSRGALSKDADKAVSRSNSRTKVFSKADSPVSKSPSKGKVPRSSDDKKRVSEAGGIPKAISKSPPAKENNVPKESMDTEAVKQDEVRSTARTLRKSTSRSGESVDTEAVKQDEVRSTARTLRKSTSRSGESGSPVRRAVSSSPGLRLGHSPSPSPGPSHGHGLRVPQQRGHRARDRGANGPLRPRSTRSTRSVSHTRPTPADDPDIPVVSLKDVERRHREMLLDKWSRSLQSLHAEQDKQARAQSESATTAAPAAPREEPTGIPAPTTLTATPRPRPALHLDLFPVAAPQPRATSPAPSDSWSVCSDASPSPTPPSTPPSPSAEEGPESVSDRIRRKSFYTRFNDIKKKKKKPTSPSSSGTLGASLLSSPSPRPRPVLDLDDALYGAATSTPRPRRSPAVSPVTGVPVVGMPYLNGGLYDAAVPASAVASPSVLTMDRSPTWERSGIELRNDLMFHNLGLHRFDPNNLSVKKESLFELLSPTGSGPASLLGQAKPTSPAATPSASTAALSGSVTAVATTVASDSPAGHVAVPSGQQPEARAADAEPQTT